MCVPYVSEDLDPYQNVWIRIRNSVYFSKESDPHQNVTDPEHYLLAYLYSIFSLLLLQLLLPLLLGVLADLVLAHLPPAQYNFKV